LKKLLYITGGIVAVALLSLYFIYDPSSFDFFPKCPLHATTGIYCPGCGSQRALHSLLHLNLAGAIGHNLLFLPALIIVVQHYIMRFMEKRDGRQRKLLLYHPRAPWVVLSVVLAFWLLRNLTFYPFELLAP
jgi:hypothetical protein